LIHDLARGYNDLGITDEPRADHAQYLTSWLSIKKGDKKVTSASRASEAVTFLAGFQTP
jgi:antirestriction protein ArdC